MTLRSVLMATAICAVVATSASATPMINWVQWDSGFTTGSTGGMATGTISTSPNVMVSYGGEVDAVYLNYPSWGPAATFDAGMNAPMSTQGIVRINGGLTSTDTITFSTPVTNPYIAIWSLGRPGIDASFNFNATPTLMSGGTSSEYGGSSIVVSGNMVSGHEGNGVVQFTGTFNSISWTNPTYENWYGFTVGIAGPADVPEPLTLALFGAGLAGLAGLRRKRRS